MYPEVVAKNSPNRGEFVTFDNTVNDFKRLRATPINQNDVTDEPRKRKRPQRWRGIRYGLPGDMGSGVGETPELTLAAAGGSHCLVWAGGGEFRLPNHALI